MADESRRFYGVQFHPEVTHTAQGQRIISRFVHDICGCPSNWQPGNIIARDIARIRAQVGRDGVLLGLSGGVDSSVVAALLHEALGDQLTCVFVDTGLLRLHEGDQLMDVFADHLGVRVIRVNAEARFLAALGGVERPGGKAQGHRATLHRGVRGGGGEDPGRALARAGHDLSGCHRIRRRAAPARPT